MKTIIYKCDECLKDLNEYNSGHFEIKFIDTIALFPVLHLCCIDCMRTYLTRQWDLINENKVFNE